MLYEEYIHFTPLQQVNVCNTAARTVQGCAMPHGCNVQLSDQLKQNPSFRKHAVHLRYYNQWPTYALFLL